MLKMRRFEEVDKLRNKLASYRPLDPSLESAIKEKFYIDWTYNSSAIEGNTYTREDTWYVYKEGRAAAGKTGDEFLEIRNHKKAVEFIEDRVKKNEKISIPSIKELHSILLNGIDSKAGREAGRYKSEPNITTMPDGSVHTYVAPHLVEDEMDELLNWYGQQRDSLHPVEMAAVLHWRFLRIHPFLNGNGRVARLLMNWILTGSGYTPAIIKLEKKQEYLEAIYAAHKDEANLASLVMIVEREAIESLTLALDVIEGREVFGVEDLERKLKDFGRGMKSLSEGYEKLEGQLEEKRKKRVVEVCDFIEKIAKRVTIENDKYVFNFHRKTERDVGEIITEISKYESLGSLGKLSEKIKNIPIIKSSGLGGLSIGFEGKGPLKNYIPRNYLSLFVFASKHKIHIACYIYFEEKFTSKQDLLEVGIDHEKLDEKKIEEFFAKSHSCLMDMVLDEAARRKRGESEQTST